jgi:glyoxylase-like metal-dependent hydrolase (beta-lactamase superfamily II)
VLAIAALAVATACGRGNAEEQFLRLYVFDCGTLQFTNAEPYQLRQEEVARTDMSMGCYLVVHPKGTLMWDVGAVVDSSWKPSGSIERLHIALPDKQERDVTIVKTLKSQLASAGYSPADITFLAFSHYHWDHIANANDFAGATWLVRKAERDIMFSTPPPSSRTIPENYSGLARSKTILLDKEDHDVFGDGKVVLKFTPGHTPGHQVLYLELPKTGRVALSGDLYHYPEERTLKRIPVRDNQAQTAASRAALEAFLEKTHAQLWIQHDITAHEKLKKAPEFYD